MWELPPVSEQSCLRKSTKRATALCLMLPLTPQMNASQRRKWMSRGGRTSPINTCAGWRKPSGEQRGCLFLASFSHLAHPRHLPPKQTEKDKSGALFDCVYCTHGCMSHSILGLVFLIWFKTQGAQFSSITQSCPTLCNPWTAVLQASLSITNSQSLLKLMPIKLVMPSNHLILSSPSPPALNLSQHQGLFQ